MSKLSILELFAGIGSQAKALRNLGIDFESDICEFDDKAVASYNAIHGETFNYGDITKTHIDKQYDLWTYSFPCQDLSNAGSRKGLEGTRSGLLYEVGRLLSECNDKDILPDTLVMENVPTLLFKNNIQGFEDWCKYLENLGYTNSYQVLNSSDFGIPQDRKRIFMVSTFSLDNTPFDFNNLKTVEMKPLESIVDFDFTHDEPTGQQHLMNFNSVKDLPHDTFIYFHDTSKNFLNGRRSSYKTDRSITVTTGNRLSKFNKGSTSKLTPLECWLLMGFTQDDFNKVSSIHSDTYLRKQAGNSIVVQVLEAIFSELYLKGD